MKQIPILFTAPMVNGILDGRKTMTRRTAKTDKKTGEYKPRYAVGDVLWVRETWVECATIDSFLTRTDIYDYKADCSAEKVPWKWRPSIYMPKTACRIFLRVIAVRFEPLNETSEADARAEGIYEVRKGGWLWDDPKNTSMPNCTLGNTAKQAFMWLWNRINAKRDDGKYAWCSNPMVEVVTFEQIEKPEGWGE